MLWLCIRLPALRTAPMDIRRQSCEMLAAWAYQYSSWVSYEAGTQDDGIGAQLWLEAGASGALFGDPAELLARIEAELPALCEQAACALAPTPNAAALLTQLPGSAQHRCVRTPAALRACLAPLPLRWLALPDAVREALHSAGLRRIGEVLALPAAMLARRFGPAALQYLQRLDGTAAHPLPAWTLPPRYHARYALEAEISEASAVLFPLRRLLLAFQGYLRARDCAVLGCRLRLEHAHAPASEITLGLSSPAREASQFLLLARERLANLSLPAPVRTLILSAEQFTAPGIVQGDFFGSESQQLAELSWLLDRLRARLGEHSVHGLRLQEEHRPECAQAHAAAAGGPTGPTQATRAARPCALLARPRRIEPPQHVLAGPERIESGWWDGNDMRRDYYVAVHTDGAQHWVFRDLDSGQWYLQGLWS